MLQAIRWDGALAASLMQCMQTLQEDQLTTCSDSCAVIVACFCCCAIC